MRALHRVRVDYGRRPAWFEPGTEMWVLRALNEDLWLAFNNIFWKVRSDRLISVRPAIIFDCCPAGPRSGDAPQPIPGDIGFAADPRAMKPESAGAMRLEDEHPLIFMEWFRDSDGTGMARVADGRLYTVRPNAVEFIRHRPGTIAGADSGAPGLVVGIEGPVEVRSHGRTWVARDALGTLGSAPSLDGIMRTLAGYAGPLEIVTGGVRRPLTEPDAPLSPIAGPPCNYPTSIAW